MAIDTTRVANRRTLHFERLEDILADVEQLNRGPMKALGNWSGGQILKHLAIVMNGSIDGGSMEVPWFLRLLGRLMKNRLLTKGMSPGYQLKGNGAKALIPPETSWDEGLAMFRAAIQRQLKETQRQPRSPFLGPMSREDWDRLHCRHAELHLSFLVPSA